MPKIDIKRLKQDVKRFQADRPSGVGPGGHRLTGNKDLVRKLLPYFDELHAQGATWANIAASLAAQGVLQGNAQPIGTNRLTALVSAVRQDVRNKALAEAARQQRSDVRRPQASPALTLSLELDAAARRSAPVKSSSEQEHRLAALDRAKTILKKD